MLSLRPGQLYARLAGDRTVRGLAGFAGRRKVKIRALLPSRLHRSTTVTRDGFTYVVSPDPLDAEILDTVINRRHDVYFPEVVGDPESIHLVFEIGAHHGLYTVAAAAEYRNATIIALEPSISALPTLAAQVAVNDLTDRVQVIAAALGSHAGIARLSHEPSGSWGATLYEPDVVVDAESVVTLTLNQILGGRQPDLIKSNAEGAEFDLVAQLADQGSLPPTMILAVHHEYGDVDKLRSDIESLGYAVSVAIDGHHPMWRCDLLSGVAPRH